MTRNELVSSPEYWDEYMLNDLWVQVALYKKRTGINNLALAKKIGISAPTLSNLWSGKHKVSTYTAARIMLAIGVVPHLMFTPLTDHLES